MSPTVIVAIALIALPIAFNALFFALGRAFDYPDILRREPGEILERFRAGGTPLLLRWWLFAMVAVAFIPVGAAVPLVLAPGTAWAGVAAGLGVASGLVQAIGLVRWPFLVPELARRHADPATSDAGRDAIELVFASIHRLLGVAIGEHLGYLLTGLWTVALAVALAVTASPVVPGWLAIPGLVIGAALLVGSLEFVGPNEPTGWSVAEALVPIAYVGWSAWLIALGAAAILGGA